MTLLDLKIINDQSGKYKFTIYHKKAITNVQIKPNADHNPNIRNGIFKWFVNRALTLCSPEHLDEELEFSTNVFLENG